MEDDPMSLPSDDERWNTPLYPLMERANKSRLGEFTLRIARELGYPGAYDGGQSDILLEECMDYFRRFSPGSQQLIFDVIVICTEHGHFTEAEMTRMKKTITKIERKHGRS